MFDSQTKDQHYDCKNRLSKTVDIPIELYHSCQGDYFIGYGDNLNLNAGTSAWARLYNPHQSGVNLHVNVWTVTDISQVPFRAQFWFNATPPTPPDDYALPTPSNTAICPAPKPKVKIQLASNVAGEPSEGIKAFVRRGEPEATLVESENGKLIFPPGGSFLVFMTLEDPKASGQARIAFGWWEQKINRSCTD